MSVKCARAFLLLHHPLSAGAVTWASFRFRWSTCLDACVSINEHTLLCARRIISQLPFFILKL